MLVASCVVLLVVSVVLVVVGLEWLSGSVVVKFELVDCSGKVVWVPVHGLASVAPECFRDPRCHGVVV